MKAADESIDRIGIFIGGMRCGSTAVLDYMRQHPQAAIHEKKDPHFFSSDENWEKGWGDYLAGWSNYDANKHRIAFESSTHYTKYPVYPKTARRMANTIIDLRLIYGVRGPLERVESHLIHNSGKGYLDPNNRQEREALLKQAINVSNFTLQLQNFEKYFASEKIFVMNLADLKARPAETMRNIFRFFGY